MLEPRHRQFLKELPLGGPSEDSAGLARMVRADTERCLHEALAHMGLAEREAPLAVQAEERVVERFEPDLSTRGLEAGDIDVDDLPF